jgi:hypothetical protein
MRIPKNLNRLYLPIRNGYCPATKWKVYSDRVFINHRPKKSFDNLTPYKVLCVSK